MPRSESARISLPVRVPRKLFQLTTILLLVVSLQLVFTLRKKVKQLEGEAAVLKVQQASDLKGLEGRDKEGAHPLEASEEDAHQQFDDSEQRTSRVDNMQGEDDVSAEKDIVLASNPRLLTDRKGREQSLSGRLRSIHDGNEWEHHDRPFDLRASLPRRRKIERERGRGREGFDHEHGIWAVGEIPGSQMEERSAQLNLERITSRRDIVVGESGGEEGEETGELTVQEGVTAEEEGGRAIGMEPENGEDGSQDMAERELIQKYMGVGEFLPQSRKGKVLLQFLRDWGNSSKSTILLPGGTTFNFFTPLDYINRTVDIVCGNRKSSKHCYLHGMEVYDPFRVTQCFSHGEQYNVHLHNFNTKTMTLVAWDGFSPTSKYLNRTEGGPVINLKFSEECPDKCLITDCGFGECFINPLTSQANCRCFLYAQRNTEGKCESPCKKGEDCCKFVDCGAGSCMKWKASSAYERDIKDTHASRPLRAEEDYEILDYEYSCMCWEANIHPHTDGRCSNQEGRLVADIMDVSVFQIRLDSDIRLTAPLPIIDRNLTFVGDCTYVRGSNSYHSMSDTDVGRIHGQPCTINGGGKFRVWRVAPGVEIAVTNIKTIWEGDLPPFDPAVEGLHPPLPGFIDGVDPEPNVWPVPVESNGGNLTVVVSSNFSMSANFTDSEVLNAAFGRYHDLIFSRPGTWSPRWTENVTSEVLLPRLSELFVTVESRDEKLEFGIDESYQLRVPADGSRIILTARTVYGALRGLETFSQLCEYDPESGQVLLRRTPWDIRDAPRFAHRGYLLDTARHFQPVGAIKAMIDSLPYAKINVVHWHAVDRESFPLQLPTYPDLAKQGAFTPAERYSMTDMREIVEYARLRGVNVMMEIDVPGHATSWGWGYPALWPRSDCREPLDISRSITFEIIEGVLEDLSTIFKYKFFHVGGDEVNTACWQHNKHIRKWLRKKKWSVSQAYGHFVKRACNIAIKHGWDPVIWEEPFKKFGRSLDNRTVVQIWITPDYELLPKIVKSGKRVLVSSSDVFYLDSQTASPFDAYTREITRALEHEGLEHKSHMVLGGEMSMWGEMTDGGNLEHISWPRLAAIGERLWSPLEKVDRGFDAAVTRLQHFRCRLLSRGVRTGPLFSPNRQPFGPNSCMGN